MRHTTRLLTVIAFCLSIGAHADEVANAMEQEARDLARQYIDAIRPELKSAMAEGGPARAIEVCASVAPRVADAISAESGWMIRRVSLNPRNASRAIPDDWEQGVLRDFDERSAKGAAPADLVHAENTGNEYRFMRAQVAEGICLTCHGTNLPPAAVATLSEYYPDDAATGYKLGDVRGAISLRKPLAN